MTGQLFEEDIGKRIDAAGTLADPANQIVALAALLAEIHADTFPAECAKVHRFLGRAYCQTGAGDRAENIERAIFHNELALTLLQRETSPKEWAAAENNLAIAYSERMRGEHAENLEQSIAHYVSALEVRTRAAAPLEWAATLYNLAMTTESACAATARKIWSNRSPFVKRR